ncbi:MAG: ComEC family competence protein [Beijerinckiaceae bacterium]|jgi:competence protein ComEC|nr:ComEC family competence protein [Beijerinckiaceae bacterium]
MAGAGDGKIEGMAPAAGAFGWPRLQGRSAAGPASVRLRDRASAAIARMIETEVAERRLFLWLPVFFGVGVLVYFAAAQEPGLAAPLTALGAALAGAWKARRSGATKLAGACMAAAFLFAGFAAGVGRTALVAAPVLERITVAKVTAYVETVDDRKGGGRLLLRVSSIDGLAPNQLPGRIRVTIRNHAGLKAGMTTRATMRLVPPAPPSEPGGYDFSREAFFQGIGAVGSIVSRVERAPPAEVSAMARINAAIDRARNDLTHRIAGVIGGGRGAVAAALVTGKRGLIPEDDTEALRGAGIYHVVSISGLHMVLAAGLFLWSFRALLALAPVIALHYPVKKWAAVFAMLGATAYCIFAGSEVATERSLIMVGVMLGAILVDRPALSMRNLAIAALIVLAREPETILGPSFQMSFGAVAAMIALFERSQGDVATGEAPQGLFARARRAVVIMLLTTFVAGLATGPFASFHFHRVNPYALIGNSLTLPLVEFIVMPSALLGVVLGPFGLDAPIWSLMGWGVGGMMEVARFVAGFQGSTSHLASFGGGALAVLSLALVWLTLWRSPIRYAAAVFACLGLGLAALYRTPDLIVDSSGRSLALRGMEGRLEVMNGAGAGFAVSQWLLGDGDARPPTHPDLAGQSRCDKLGCVGRLQDGRTVALVLDMAALQEDCGRADILVTRLWAASMCRGPELLLDGAHFAAHGATELRLAESGDLLMKVSRPAGLNRPWAKGPAPRQTTATGVAPGGEPAPDDSARDTDENPAPYLAE